MFVSEHNILCGYIVASVDSAHYDHKDLAWCIFCEKKYFHKTHFQDNFFFFDKLFAECKFRVVDGTSQLEDIRKNLRTFGEEHKCSIL